MDKSDIQSLWDYSDPVGSEAEFQAVLAETSAETDISLHAELLTQIARAQGLQRKFDEAHSTLDKAEVMIEDDMCWLQVRLLLERGRVFNSSGSKERAKELFIKAWKLASKSNIEGIDGLAVDAAHMIGIVEDADESLKWNRKALDLANSLTGPEAQKWKGSLCNNMGWTHHGNGNFEAAIAYFQEALDQRNEQGKDAEIRVARWCLARCLRSLGRVDEALIIQRELEKETEGIENPDGFIPEEIAECLYALGKKDEAKPYFRKAYDLLSKDAWLSENEPKRIERLKELCEVNQ